MNRNVVNVLANFVLVHSTVWVAKTPVRNQSIECLWYERMCNIQQVKCITSEKVNAIYHQSICQSTNSAVAHSSRVCVWCVVCWMLRRRLVLTAACTSEYNFYDRYTHYICTQYPRTHTHKACRFIGVTRAGRVMRARLVDVCGQQHAFALQTAAARTRACKSNNK